MQQKATLLEKENEKLAGFLAKEQQQAERGRGLIARLEHMVQRLSDEAQASREATAAAAAAAAGAHGAAEEQER